MIATIDGGQTEEDRYNQMHISNSRKITERKGYGAESDCNVAAGNCCSPSLENLVNPTHKPEKCATLDHLREPGLRGELLQLRRQGKARGIVEKDRRSDHRHDNEDRVTNVEYERHNRYIVEKLLPITEI